MKIYPAYVSKHNSNREKQVILSFFQTSYSFDFKWRKTMASSVVLYLRLSGQFQARLVFFYEKILGIKNTSQVKTN